MNYKVLFNSIKKRLTELWKLKSFRYAILLHFFYFLLSIIVTLFFLRTQSDFYVYYSVGEIFVNNPNNLYNPAF